MEVPVLSDERVDDLQYKGLKIIQHPSAFCFGTDAVLLSHFADVRKGDRVVDLGTGTGIIPILLAGRTEAATIIGIEIQEPMAEMARRSIALNGLEDRIQILYGDLKEAPNFLGKGYMDVVVSNPPYKKQGSGIVSREDAHAIARHELRCTLEDVIRVASSMLRSGGRFCLIHQSDRMMDILFLMREHHIEPKRIRLIHSFVDQAPNLVLLEGIRNGKPYLTWMPPLIIREQDGSYTSEINEIYHRGKFYE